jgi:hypothetical protein
MYRRWKVGDRVVRWENLDNGKWAEIGDSCLPGPLRHGTIIRRYILVEEDRLLNLVDVLFDDGKKRSGFFDHGLDGGK